jgi:hypothetical protein
VEKFAKKLHNSFHFQQKTKNMFKRSTFLIQYGQDISKFVYHTGGPVFGCEFSMKHAQYKRKVAAIGPFLQPRKDYVESKHFSENKVEFYDIIYRYAHSDLCCR